jgi:SRSO17 transposase
MYHGFHPMEVEAMIEKRDSGVCVGLVKKWGADFEKLWEAVGSCFFRHDLRGRAKGYVHGLLGRVERKNGWQMAEYLGDATPHPVQRLLDRAVWNADDVRDEIIRYARSHLLTAGEGGVLIVDETGFLKKGDKSVGVQRQYSGTAGRIENCQIGVFLALACSGGRALLDRELYLPKSWCDDSARFEAAHIPSDVKFATKQRLAQKMLTHALESGLSPDWVLADEVYGSDSKFRRFLEERGQPYVLAVSSQQRLWVGLSQRRVDAIARELAPENWHRASAGDGMKGPRLYDWAAGKFGVPTEDGLVRWLLVRRSIEKPEELAYYLCLTPVEATLDDLVKAAGQRWNIECCFEAAKQETGLDEYEVRSWHGWYRHITLSMLALIFLSVVRSKANGGRSRKKRTKSSCL